MAYNINKTDGSPLVTVGNSTFNNTASSITIVGKNYANYGEIVWESIVHMLENFSNATPPVAPMAGQLWYDTSAASKQLKIYDGAKFINIQTIFKGPAAPPVAIDGDFWFDTVTKQLKAYDGTANKWVIIGPISPSNIPTTVSYLSIEDNAGGFHTAFAQITNDQIVSIWSTDLEYIPRPNSGPGSQAIYIGAFDKKVFPDGFQSIRPGFNMNTTVFGTNSVNVWGKVGEANNASSLGNLPANKYPVRDRIETISGAWTFTTTVTAPLFNGTATSAYYADLAERYSVHGDVEPGDVVCLDTWSDEEVVKSTVDADINVFGVVSTNPAIMMNSGAGDDTTHPYVALVGRVPCKVTGVVKKGDRLTTSSLAGVARRYFPGLDDPFAVFGRALQSKTSVGVETIEIVVGK